MFEGANQAELSMISRIWTRRGSGMALEAPQKAAGRPRSGAKMKAVEYSVIFRSPLVGLFMCVCSDMRLFRGYS